MLNKENKKEIKKILLAFALLPLLFLPFSLARADTNLSNSGFATSLGVGGNFGGKVFSTIPCTNGGLALVVGPPSPGLFLFQVGFSRLYREFSLKPGVSVLGNYTFGGFCLVGFVPVFVQGTIRNVGTSL